MSCCIPSKDVIYKKSSTTIGSKVRHQAKGFDSKKQTTLVDTSISRKVIKFEKKDFFL